MRVEDADNYEVAGAGVTFRWNPSTGLVEETGTTDSQGAAAFEHNFASAPAGQKVYLEAYAYTSTRSGWSWSSYTPQAC